MQGAAHESCRHSLLSLTQPQNRALQPHHLWKVTAPAGPPKGHIMGTSGRQHAATHIAVDSTSNSTPQFLWKLLFDLSCYRAIYHTTIIEPPSVYCPTKPLWSIINLSLFHKFWPQLCRSLVIANETDLLSSSFRSKCLVRSEMLPVQSFIRKLFSSLPAHFLVLML